MGENGGEGSVPRLTIYRKILILIVLLLLPVLLLYYFSNRISNGVIRQQIEWSNLNQLSFFANQLDAKMEQLSMFPVIISYDPHIRQFVDTAPEQRGLMLVEQSRVLSKLGLQSVSSDWNNELTIVFPGENRLLSSSIFLNMGDVRPVDGRIRSNWTYQPPAAGRDGAFVREIAEPASAEGFAQAKAVYQIRFFRSNLVEMLHAYKADHDRYPFFFHRHHGTIFASEAFADDEVIGQIIGHIRQHPLRDPSGQFAMRASGQRILVSYVQSEQLGWYLIDYTPMEQILSPITRIGRLFYLSIGLLLLMGAIAAYVLYSQVQRPILALIAGMQSFKRGKFSARIAYDAGNEFNFLFRRFNEMAEQIQTLIEDVYAERIRSREAKLKQLQSQINPHFLYNSLFFIINSSAMGDHDAVEAMAHHLAELFRYSTRTDDQLVTLGEELEMVRHYLSIHHLRMHRLEFEISVPEEILAEPVPKMILQPIVENAVEHGIADKPGGGRIAVTGERDGETCRVRVADNGSGMEERELEQLRERLGQPMDGGKGFGTWNVHHRLLNHFGEGSGLHFERNETGGLTVTLVWNRSADTNSAEGGERNDRTAHRG